MTPTTTWAFVIVSALGQAFQLVYGEVFHLNQRPIPGAYSIQSLTVFTVYVPRNGPAAQTGDEAGDEAGEGAFVEFRSVQAHSTDPSKVDGDLADYGGIQLSLVSVDDYGKHPAYCDAGDRLSPLGASMLTYTVGFTKTRFVHSGINKTGTYALIMSNCGSVSQGEVSGQVAVRNPFGYMSRTQYHKASFYGYVSMFYMALAVIWGALCITSIQGLFAIHAILGLVIGLKLMECASWTVHLNSVNESGSASDAVVCIMVMLTTLTSYTSYSFILAISKGCWMIEEVLEASVLVKMGVFGLIWLVINFVREVATVKRHTLIISSSFMTMTTVGSTIINAVFFLWVILSLARLSRKLRERSLDDQLKAIYRVTCALVFATVASAAVAFLQLLDSTGSLQLTWKHQYLADGGLSQVAFAFVVVAAMCAWAPSEGRRKPGYAAPEDGPGKEDGAHEDAEQVAPATVGAADEDLC